METKICNKCERELPKDRRHFHLDIKQKDGFNPNCKECRGFPFHERIKAKDGYKVCSKCERELPLTPEFFTKNPQNKFGFNCRCKECSGKKFKKNKKPTEYGFKICSICGNKLPSTLDFFHAANRYKDGINNRCKKCESERGKIKYENNKESAHIRGKKYRKENKFEINERIRIYNNNRRKTDPCFRILCSLRARVRSVIIGENKSESTKKLIGCSIEEFKYHIESLFESGMTWENYGKKNDQWSLDHIIPLAYFDLTTIDGQLSGFNWKNTRPMWNILNITKQSLYNGIRYKHKRGI